MCMCGSEGNEEGRDSGEERDFPSSPSSSPTSAHTPPPLHNSSFVLPFHFFHCKSMMQEGETKGCFPLPARSVAFSCSCPATTCLFKIPFQGFLQGKKEAVSGKNQPPSLQPRVRRPVDCRSCHHPPFNNSRRRGVVKKIFRLCPVRQSPAGVTSSSSPSSP